jgi:hypothetical protein
VETPRPRVLARPLLDKADGPLSVNRRQDYRAVLVGGEELRVEGGGLFEQWRESVELQRPEVVELVRARVGRRLAADVLQPRASPRGGAAARPAAARVARLLYASGRALI